MPVKNEKGRQLGSLFYQQAWDALRVLCSMQTQRIYLTCMVIFYSQPTDLVRLPPKPMPLPFNKECWNALTCSNACSVNSGVKYSSQGHFKDSLATFPDSALPSIGLPWAIRSLTSLIVFKVASGSTELSVSTPATLHACFNFVWNHSLSFHPSTFLSPTKLIKGD